MENLNGTGKIIGALFLGALIGGALGVLFAPEKGSKTRRDIAEGAKDLTSDIKKKIKEEVYRITLRMPLTLDLDVYQEAYEAAVEYQEELHELEKLKIKIYN